MSYGGHVAEMIARLKANARAKRDAFGGLKERQGVQGSGPIPAALRKATPEQLEAIRTRLTTERRQAQRRTILFAVLVVGLMAIAWAIWM